MATEKMSWLIEKHKNGNVSYEIQNTHRNHGAISKPTGSGKSALFINDIIYRIIHRENKKLMVNISTPIIKLCEQQGNDLMEVIEGVKEYYGINTNEIKYFINNSGDIDSYKNNKSSSLHSFSTINKNFINSSKCNIAIVINCHPSLSERMIPCLKKLDNEIIDIVTYIDEAHTISSKIATEQDDTTIDLNILCKKSSVYLMSATNKQELVKLVNSYDVVNDTDDSYIILETPANAINANKICAPKVHIKQTTSGEIDFDICNDFMNMIIKDGNIHKVLITCKDTKSLKSLKNQLKENGYTVFSTCSSEGMNWSDTVEYENSNHKFNDVVSFIKAIDDCTSNCFILHIRQMISGIDVSSISDCIIQKNDTDNFNSYSNIIQTIGRSLRLGKERGINVENRNKKYANVLFLTEETNETVYSDIEKFLINYYGIGQYKFNIGKAGIKHSSTTEEVDLGWENMFNNVSSGDTINYWENIKTNIRKYIIEKVKPIIDVNKELGVPYRKKIENEINIIEKKYNESLNGIYIFKYIENKDLRNEVEKIMNEIIK